MLGCKDPSSSPSGPTFQSPYPRRTFSSKITLTMMLWSYLVSSRDFWSIIFWLTQAVQRISYFLRPSNRCKSQRTRSMILHTLFVASEDGRLWHLAKSQCQLPSAMSRTHELSKSVFDIFDMEYPYSAIIGRGTLNAFEAILHPAYLCMKIPSEQGPIAVHGSQEAARRAEGSWTVQRQYIT
jgi:hypothetical protein